MNVRKGTSTCSGTDWEAEADSTESAISCRGGCVCPYTNGKAFLCHSSQLQQQNKNQQKSDLVQAIAGHKIVKSLQGHPSKIYEKAYEMSEKEYYDLIKETQAVISNQK